MKGQEYEKRISALGLNQVQSAIMLGVNDRTVRRWIADDAPIPHPVAIVLTLMQSADQRRILCQSRPAP